MRLPNFKSQAGSILLPLILTLPLLILMATYYLNLSGTSFKLAVRDQFHTHAQLAVDAAIDLGMQEINEDGSWTGTGPEDGSWTGTGYEVELFNDTKSRTTYQTTVTTNNPDSKTITSVGRSYRPASSTTPESSVTVKADLRAVTAGGSYSLVTGVGGLYMSNSAKIVGGEVFVNGEISMQNSAQIGLTTSPLSVQVAHQNCPVPADAFYPRLCASGENGQPISLQNSAHIYGDVKANNQTSGTGMSNPGLTASSGVAPGSLPDHDRIAQKAAITSTITGSSASCSGSATKTWAANTKITGNVTISNSCKVTVQGDIWITGLLTVQNSGQVIVADSLGTTRPTIMVDGQKVDLKNSTLLKSNTSSTGFQIINYWSTASCSPDCGDVTDTDLYNSRDDTTIELQNSASGPQSIFYSRWTRVQITNSGQIGALVGQTVDLKNSGIITFGTSVVGGTSTTWIIDGYRRVFN